jgi:hypothetical protein
MKKLMALFALLLLGCVPQHDKITESEVRETIEGFFQSIDVENDDPNLIDTYITDDFLLYEAGQKMTKSEFLEFVSGFPITETDWELSDFRISTDNNSAHASLYNTGFFVMETDSTRLNQKYEWLESAYLIRVDGQLKIKFYFSDNINIETIN